MQFPSGSEVFDKLMDGGYQSQLLNTIYGPAASGKTTACLLAAIACVERGKKVVFVDTENGFAVERLKQLAGDYKKVVEGIMLYKVNNFNEQILVFQQLPEVARNPKVGLIIVDTIGAQYRADQRNVQDKIERLAEQVDILRGIYKATDSCIIVTNQVYANPEEQVDKPVGGKTLVNRSKCLIQLRLLNDNKRVAILKKLPGVEIEKAAVFEIREKGFFLV